MVRGEFMNHKLLSGILILILITAVFCSSYLPYDIDESIEGRTQLMDSVCTFKTFLNPRAIIKSNVGGNKLVALTIDDGPDPRYTQQILSILQQYNIRATFFVVGQNIKQYPDLLIEEIRAGNEIENHTYTHPNLRLESMKQTNDEIMRTQELIENYTHKRPQYFRPPRGLLGRNTLELSESDGYKVVLWTICMEHSVSKTPQAMAARVIKAASPGIIILAHDGRLDRSRTIAALPMVIEGYKKKGYRFVTLDEILKQGQYQGELAQTNLLFRHVF